MGGGTRIKIFEGMAMGKATVSTTLGAEGLDVENGLDILLEDEPSGFADAVIGFLQGDALRRRYEAQAAATARKYDWSVVTRSFAEILQTTIAAAENHGVASGSIATTVRI
jgi:glycosyltransferase involved in cell wall biosynthesis